jgi:hypothetical protein
MPIIIISPLQGFSSIPKGWNDYRKQNTGNEPRRGEIKS